MKGRSHSSAEALIDQDNKNSSSSTNKPKNKNNKKQQEQPQFVVREIKYQDGSIERIELPLSPRAERNKEDQSGIKSPRNDNEKKDGFKTLFSSPLMKILNPNNPNELATKRLGESKSTPGSELPSPAESPLSSPRKKKAEDKTKIEAEAKAKAEAVRLYYSSLNNDDHESYEKNKDENVKNKKAKGSLNIKPQIMTDNLNDNKAFESYKERTKKKMESIQQQINEIKIDSKTNCEVLNDELQNIKDEFKKLQQPSDAIEQLKKKYVDLENKQEGFNQEVNVLCQIIHKLIDITIQNQQQSTSSLILLQNVLKNFDNEQVELSGDGTNNG